MTLHILNLRVSGVPGVPGDVPGMKNAESRTTLTFAASVPGVPGVLRAHTRAHTCAHVRAGAPAPVPAHPAHPAHARHTNTFARAGCVPPPARPAHLFSRARLFFISFFSKKWEVKAIVKNGAADLAIEETHDTATAIEKTDKLAGDAKRRSSGSHHHHGSAGADRAANHQRHAARIEGAAAEASERGGHAVTPSDERHLHDTDRAAWLRYVAPRLRVKLFQHPSLALAWATLQRDTQLAVWDLLNEPEREKVRAARATSGDTEPTA